MSYIVPIKYTVNIDNSAYFIAAMITEVLIGYTIGFVAYIVFASIQLAGQLMDMQMGFGMVNVVDPMSGVQIPLMGNFAYALSLLVYLGLDGHHYLLQAIAQSYEFIPVLGVGFNNEVIAMILDVTIYMFVIAIKISAPIVMAVLISDVSMGFIARTVPQMNVFIVGLPLKIGIGLLSFFLMIPVFIWFIGVLFSRFVQYLDAVILAMGL